jgi:hypothetical protein
LDKNNGSSAPVDVHIHPQAHRCNLNRRWSETAAAQKFKKLDKQYFFAISSFPQFSPSLGF